MSDIQTIHYNENGVQHTKRVVTVTDAKGDEAEHVFLETDDGHEYQGEGTAPESAQDALAEFEEDYL